MASGRSSSCKTGASPRREAAPNSSPGEACMRPCIEQPTSHHAQRKRRAQSRGRLVGQADPAERRLERGPLYRDRPDIPHDAEQGGTRRGIRVARLVLRGLLVRAWREGVVLDRDYTLLNGALVMADERIEIGSYCLISWNVGIADSDFHPIAPAQRRIDALALAPYFKDKPPRPKLETRPVRIADNVWIGMNAIILKGVSIGENSVVAAGSVVTKSIPPNTVVAGNPAVTVKQL